MQDDLLLHARFINFTNRDTAEFSDVEYFIERYSSLLNFTAHQLDDIHEEFVAYQLLRESNIPSDVWAKAKEQVEDIYGDNEQSR